MVKYVELLEAANDKYMNMFNKLLKILETELASDAFIALKQEILANITKTKQKSKNREDLIILYIKLYRTKVCDSLQEYKKNEKLSTLYYEYIKEFGVSKSTDIYKLIETLDHYSSMMDKEPYKSYRFTASNSQQIIQDINNLDSQYKKKKEQDAQKLSSDDETVAIINFPDGSAWFDLNKNYCEAEGEAMGHCGNKGNYSTSDTVLSYRTPNSDGTWTPHLTFILDKDRKTLGEMKGRGNSKPIAKYHPYIIVLLKSDYVDGIVGGGYKPQNNFSLSDVDSKLLKELYEVKPEIFKHQYKASLIVGNYDHVRDMLVNALEVEIEPEGDYERVGKFDSNGDLLLLKYTSLYDIPTQFTQQHENANRILKDIHADEFDEYEYDFIEYDYDNAYYFVNSLDDDIKDIIFKEWKAKYKDNLDEWDTDELLIRNVLTNKADRYTQSIMNSLLYGYIMGKKRKYYKTFSDWLTSISINFDWYIEPSSYDDDDDLDEHDSGYASINTYVKEIEGEYYLTVKAEYFTEIGLHQNIDFIEAAPEGLLENNEIYVDRENDDISDSDMDEVNSQQLDDDIALRRLKQLI